MLVLLGDVLPHHEEDGRADQGVLDRAREEEGPRVGQQLAHDVVLAVAEGDQVAEVKVLGEALVGGAAGVAVGVAGLDGVVDVVDVVVDGAEGRVVEEEEVSLVAF